MGQTILIFGMAPPERGWLASILGREGFAVALATGTAQAQDDALALGAGLAIVEGGEALGGLLETLWAAAPAGSLSVLVLGGEGASGRASALDAGADDCLSRPFDERELFARVRALLRTRARVDALLERQRELELLSRTDGLTGLLNPRALHERLREEFLRAQRHGDPLSVVAIDVDRFKGLNDRRGHAFGDRALRRVAELVAASARETDLCSRVGGDEFAVILPRTGLGGALVLAERVRGAVAGAELWGERTTVSLGVASCTGSYFQSAELLLRAADEALYVAKRAGGDRTRLSEEGAAGAPASVG